METIKIKSIFINDKKKDGTPYVGQYGPYSIAKLTTEDGRQMSKFVTKGNDPVRNWKPGMEVDVVVEENGEFLNFDLPDETDELSQQVAELKEEFAEFKNKVSPFLNKISKILAKELKEYDQKELSESTR